MNDPRTGGEKLKTENQKLKTERGKTDLKYPPDQAALTPIRMFLARMIRTA
ncbi:MAG: hypothetical protein OXB98_14670 [Bryobacterales bacterium]|nr:hypothetical protein [Bryobacterales bacterium]